jgi:hypothetical protein
MRSAFLGGDFSCDAALAFIIYSIISASKFPSKTENCAIKAKCFNKASYRTLFFKKHKKSSLSISKALPTQQNRRVI